MRARRSAGAFKGICLMPGALTSILFVAQDVQEDPRGPDLLGEGHRRDVPFHDIGRWGKVDEAAGDSPVPERVAGQVEHMVAEEQSGVRR